MPQGSHKTKTYSRHTQDKGNQNILLWKSSISFISLSIFRAIILNSLSGNSCISIALLSVTGSLLCCFDGVLFPWFFMIPVVLCSCLFIWRSSDFFHSLWTDFGRKDLHLQEGALWGMWRPWVLECQEHGCVVAVGTERYEVSLVLFGHWSLQYRQLCDPWRVLQWLPSQLVSSWHLHIKQLGTRAGSGGRQNQ